MTESQPLQQTTKRSFKTILIALAYLLLSLIFYAPLVLGVRTFPDGDFTHHFLPFSLFQQQELLAGRLPVWNPYTYSGHPFLADIQAAVFYPLNNLLLLLTGTMPEPSLRLYWLQIEAVLHIALAGFFTYLFLFTLTRQRWASFIGGTIFAFSGYLTGYPPLQLAILRSAVWLPLILCCLWRAFRQPTQWRWWIGGALAYSCAFLAGHPQTFLHISYMVVGWLTFCFIQNNGTGMKADEDGYSESSALVCSCPRPKSLSAVLVPRIIGVVAFYLITLGLCAAQLLPSLEFMQLSVRANVDYAYVSGGFPLRDSWQLLLPGVFTHFSPLYIGIVGLGLAALAIANRNQRSLVIFFGGVTFIGLMLSYGENGFLYPFFYKFMPGWSLFRGQERVAYLVAFSLSILSGIGAATLSQVPLQNRRRAIFTFSAIPIASIYGFGLLWQLGGHTAISETQYLIIAAMTLLLAMGLALLLWREGWSQRRWRALCLLVLVNLFWANMLTNVSEFSPARKTILAPEMEALESAINTASASDLPGRAYNEHRIYEDYGMRQQIEDVWGSSPLRLARYADLFDAFPLDRMWQLTAVQHLLTWRQELFAPGTLLAEFPQTADTTYLHKLDDSYPRAWLVSNVHVQAEADVLEVLADPEFDLTQNAVVSADLFVEPDSLEWEKWLQNPEPIVWSTDQAPADGKIQAQRLAPNRLYFEIESETGGLLVISENWMPGWQMKNVVCGSPYMDVCYGGLGTHPLSRISPLFRVNHTMMGTIIPVGTQTFELVYWPGSIRYGLWISGLTLLFLTLVSCYRWSARRE